MDFPSLIRSLENDINRSSQEMFMPQDQKFEIPQELSNERDSFTFSSWMASGKLWPLGHPLHQT
jgi:hypothetical protein